MTKLATAAMLVAGGLLAIGCGPVNRNKKKPKYGASPYANEAPPPAPAAVAAGKYTLMPTSASTALLRVTTDPVDEERPALSPDGSTLLVGLRVWDEATKATRFPAIIAVDPNGGSGRTPLTPVGAEGNRAAWLPDGSTFVYLLRTSTDWSLVRSNSKLPGAGFSVIAGPPTAALADYPTVARDGLVAFTVDVQNIQMIATARLDGSGYQLVQQGSHAAFSPDGKRIAFARNVGDSMQLFISDRSGGSIQQLTYGKANALWPSWSPDGQFLAFASNRGTEQQPPNAQHSHIFVIRATGGGVTKLTDGTADCGFPNWGVDGNVYFNSDQAGNYDIWRVRPVLTAVGSSI